MALTAYVQQVQRLLHDTTGQFYQYPDLTYYVNSARGQVALEGECTRALCSLATANGQQSYTLSSIGNLPSGGQYALVVRGIYLNGQTYEARPWEWFANLCLGTAFSPAVPVWAQLGSGASSSLYICPTPSVAVALQVDSVIQPIPLNTDADPELIPYPWTDAVPYYAAYLAYLDAQRTQDAQLMFELYTTFVNRARKIVTPTSNARQWPGALGAQIAGAATGLANPQGLPNG
ncbi:MAG TPA: hypothetical protein VMT20_15295 [Terriglobia bacterium]|nr:hypothetical protein [Terriglobia bacterium]